MLGIKFVISCYATLLSFQGYFCELNLFWASLDKRLCITDNRHSFLWKNAFIDIYLMTPPNKANYIWIPYPQRFVKIKHYFVLRTMYDRFSGHSKLVVLRLRSHTSRLRSSMLSILSLKSYQFKFWPYFNKLTILRRMQV